MAQVGVGVSFPKERSECAVRQAEAVKASVPEFDKAHCVL